VKICVSSYRPTFPLSVFDVLQLCCVARLWDGCRLSSVRRLSVVRGRRWYSDRMLATSYRLSWLRATAECFARLSHRLSVRLSVCLFFCPSKQCKVKSQNLHCGLPQVSSFSWQNFVPLGAEVPLERGRQRWVGQISRFRISRFALYTCPVSLQRPISPLTDLNWQTSEFV